MIPCTVLGKWCPNDRVRRSGSQDSATSCEILFVLEATRRVISNIAKKTEKPAKHEGAYTGDDISRHYPPQISFAHPHPQPSHPRPAIPLTSVIQCRTCLTFSLCVVVEEKGNVPRKTSFHAADHPALDPPSRTRRTFSAGAPTIA